MLIPIPKCFIGTRKDDTSFSINFNKALNTVNKLYDPIISSVKNYSLTGSFMYSCYLIQFIYFFSI